MSTKAATKDLPYIQFDENELVRSITRESLFEFVKEFWETIETRELVLNWHIKYICDELQRVAERVIRNEPKKYDLIINIPPGATKSTVASIMFPAWVWTRMPEAQFVTASYKFDLAMDLSRKTRDIILSGKYQGTFPGISLRSDQKVKTHYMNTCGGFRVASGTGGAIGFHGHFIIVDDPIDPKEISETGIKTANIWMDETLSQRKVDKRIVPTILIMQRLHQGDPTAHMIESSIEGTIKHICLPAELTDNVKPSEMKKYYVNGLLDPLRHPVSVLEAAKKKGEYFYSGQFGQNPVPRGGAMFKTERITIDTPPSKWAKRVRFWDKAGTQNGGAYTVGVLMGKNCDGKFWVLDVVRGRWDAGAREQKIRQVADMDGKQVMIGVEVEPGSGGKESAEATARRLAGYRVRLDRPTGDKVARADPLAAQVNTGGVSMVKGEWNTEYLNEMQYFPMSTYKDQVDASSGAFNLLNKAEPFVGVLGAF